MLEEVMDSVPTALSAGFVTLLVIIATVVYTKKRQLGAQENQVVQEKFATSGTPIKTANSWEGTTKKSEAEKELPENSPTIDPVDFAGHIPSTIKKTQQRVAMKKIEAGMSEEQKQREREVQRQQLADIFNLMETESEKFGVDTMEEMQSQLGLYVQ